MVPNGTLLGGCRPGLCQTPELCVLPPPAVSPISSSFRSLERGRPGLFTSRLLSLEPCFVPTPIPTSGTAAPLGGPGRMLRPGSPAPAREEAESQRLGENGRAAENSIAPHSRFWPGHHNLRGTERCLLKLILVLGSDWEGFFFFFPSSPETFLFHTQPSLPACRSCLPRPPPLPNPPALHQGCYPVAQIGGANSR